ncbi:MAG: GntR family transcriptional regulator [Tenericutes bacterium HGW-Tenericutes-1]|jgi:GntR family transcriptional regulator|nr:MAG: GntR family transcriptional regulator [Tenericutes bacterium HGW-Tenericutes-1]
MKNIQILSKSNKPIYQQIYDQISNQIILKKLEANSQLPSIRAAAKELRVSIITIKKTWEMLEQNHFIYTVPGVGAFVNMNSDTFLLDKKNQKVEGLLMEVIHECKLVGITQDELKELVDIMYEEK